jgi:hypothetical protein
LRGNPNPSLKVANGFRLRLIERLLPLVLSTTGQKVFFDGTLHGVQGRWRKLLQLAANLDFNTTFIDPLILCSGFA